MLNAIRTVSLYRLGRVFDTRQPIDPAQATAAITDGPLIARASVKGGLFKPDLYFGIQVGTKIKNGPDVYLIQGHGWTCPEFDRKCLAVLRDALPPIILHLSGKKRLDMAHNLYVRPSRHNPALLCTFVLEVPFRFENWAANLEVT